MKLYLKIVYLYQRPDGRREVLRSHLVEEKIERVACEKKKHDKDRKSKKKYFKKTQRLRNERLFFY